MGLAEQSERRVRRSSSLPSVSVPACVLRVPLPASSSGTRALSFPPSPSPPFPCQLPWAGESLAPGCRKLSAALGLSSTYVHEGAAGGGAGRGSRWSRRGLEASTRPGRQGSGARQESRLESRVHPGAGLTRPSVDIASSPGVQGRETGGLSWVHHPCNKGL